MKDDILMVDDKVDFLIQMPQEGIVAEVGVAKGIHAEQMEDITNPERLYLIDTWEGRLGCLDEMEETFLVKTLENDEFNVEVNLDEVVAMKETSAAASGKFPDEFFDYVYIDTVFTYAPVCNAIECWFPKVKSGGYLTGNNYTDGWGSTPDPEYGVIRAVDEFVEKHGLELSFISKSSDWAVLKK